MLGDASSGRDNNFNLIRMVAALAVMVSHAWTLTSSGPTWSPFGAPFVAVLGFDLGKLGVFIFFAISGFLIAGSYDRQPTVGLWIAARAARLLPGLGVMLALTAFLLGPIVTTLPLTDYFTDPATLSYLPYNLSLLQRQGTLPGVFTEAPHSADINGSLWTLSYEVLCYIGVLAIGLAGAFRTRAVMAAVAVLFVGVNAAALVVPPEHWPFNPRILLSLALPFACGVAFYAARMRLPLRWWGLAPLLALCLLLRSGPAFQPILMLTLTYAVMLAAYRLRGPILAYNRLGDYSYGVYIYAFPVQQLMIHWFHPMSPLLNLALSLPVVLILAWLSWVLIERPALSAIPRRPATRAARIENVSMLHGQPPSPS